MKKHIVMLFLTIPFGGLAQEQKYTAGFEVGSSFQVSPAVEARLKKNVVSLINANFINGFNPNNRLFLGAGVGIEYSTWTHGNWLISEKYDAINMPLFARFRINFLTSKISPFFQTDLGYNVLLSSHYLREYSERSYKRGGVLFSPSFGVNFNLNETQKFFVNVQYILQTQGESDYYIFNNIHSVGIRLGMLF